ncbi:hypothetical protein SORBI_3001G279000 [Sorghum bicolor]|uniref:Uncharacterized protein n=1 Tax=Sorghum bicolor TaxID=4558 RepID=A0A1B6QME8_SORBI|nr:hypothetical protein SORBI_3001G279000 [Sorghum bicolor]
MPPPRRARLSSRPYYSVAASERSSSTRGWLAVRRNRPSKRSRSRAPAPTIAQGDEEDDGTPLTDEILVGIFAGLPDFSDLVRCAATCKRWCRLVSREAAFICRSAAVPRFAATASASRRLALRQPSLNALVEGLDDGLFDSSRLVASRNGLVVVELQRGKRERALKLCVCNPMTGEVTVLPSLGGKEIVRPYACTIITADDDVDDDDDRTIGFTAGTHREHSQILIHSSSDCAPPQDQNHGRDSPRAPSSYNVLLVYCRRGFTACRTYASDSGRWGREEKVTDATRLGKKQMAAMAAGNSVVAHKVVYWHAKTMVFALRLGTLHAEHLQMPDTGKDAAGNTLLGVSPEGWLRVVQVVEKISDPSSPPATVKRSVSIVVVTGQISATDDGECLWDQPQPRQVIEVVGRFLPSSETTWIQLQWMCEKSGVVFFTAGCVDDDQTGDVYAMSLDKQEVEKVANHHGGPSTWENLHGYEMDRTSYLSSLAMDEDDP